MINLSFADDWLIFARSDPISIELVMHFFKEFSQSTGLDVNPNKCKVLFGNVEANNQQIIQNPTNFSVGLLSFRYLGIPLTSKKLFVNQCMVLVDKIVGRIRHWSSRILSFVGHTQVTKSVLFTIANYWMQYIPISKKVI